MRDVLQAVDGEMQAFFNQLMAAPATKDVYF